jgi:TolA-binding protein
MARHQKFFSASNFLGMSLIAVAISVALVGVVWASSSALDRQQNSTASTSSGSAQSSDADVINAPDSSDSSSGTTPNNDYERRVQELADRLEATVKDVDNLANQMEDVEENAVTQDTRLTQLVTELADVKSDVKSLRKDIDGLKTTFGGLDDRVSSLAALVARKTSALDDDGKYTGSIGPSQISPQLRVADISGNWPMNRTTGDLEVSRLNSDLSWCSADSRNYSVLSVDAFRRIACLRIPK